MKFLANAYVTIALFVFMLCAGAYVFNASSEDRYFARVSPPVEVRQEPEQVYRGLASEHADESAPTTGNAPTGDNAPTPAQ